VGATDPTLGMVAAGEVVSAITENLLVIAGEPLTVAVGAPIATSTASPAIAINLFVPGFICDAP
jgi:hypothetical protein